MEKNRRLIDVARPLRWTWSVLFMRSVTFHRAIDMTCDMLEATEVLS